MTSGEVDQRQRAAPPQGAAATEGQARAGPIARALSVRADEVATVRRLVAAAFVLGAALILFYGASNAIFLTRYDVGVLPWVYIVNALAVILVGMLYGAASKRLPGGAALVRLMIGLSATVAGLWLWASLSSDRVVAFVLATWFRLLFIYAVLGLWEIASAVFDIRQAKRLFPAVALGMMLAFVIGGALSPVLGTIVGATNMVGASALLLAAYTVRFAQLLRGEDIGGGASSSSAPAGPRDIFRDRYSRRMVWMKSVTITLMYVTEYVFYQQAADVFSSEAALAGFFGTFMGVTTLVMVLVTGLVAGRFITRFGIRVATVTLPAGMLGISVLAGVYGSTVAVDTIFFALVCTTLATNHVLGNAIGEPAGAVLFQPMAVERRMRVRLAVDGWLGSVALIASGVLLLILNAIDLDTVAPYMFLIAAVAAAGVVIARRQYADYVQTLRDATTLGFAGSGHDLDPLGRTALTEICGREDPGGVIAAAALLRSTDHDPLAPIADELTRHPHAEVVDLALDAIASSGAARHVPSVLDVLARRSLPAATRRRALRCLSTLAPDRAAAWLDTDHDPVFDPDRPVVFLRHPPDAARGEAALRGLADGGGPQRRSACEAIAELGQDAYGLLPGLLEDRDPEVRAAALDAVAGEVSHDVAARTLAAASDPSTRRHAVAALGRLDVGALPPLDATRLADLPGDLRADLLTHVVARRPEATSELVELLSQPQPPVVRHAAYEAIVRSGSTLEPALARTFIEREVETATAIADTVRALGGVSTALASALADDLTQTHLALTGALALVHDPNRMGDIALLLRSGHDDDRATAVEALDVSLDPSLRRPVVRVFEPADQADAAPATANDADAWMARLRDDARLSIWTRRVAAASLPRTTGPVPDDGASPLATDIENVVSLKRVDIFSTLPYDVIAELASAVTRTTYAPGQVILQEGAVGDDLFALVSGEVQVSVGGHVTATLADHTVFGELAVIDPGPRAATVTATTEVELLVVQRRTLVALAERRPAVMTEIARVLARRLRG